MQKKVKCLLIFVKIFFLFVSSESKGFFAIIGSDTLPYRQKYPLVVTSDSFTSPETIEVNIWGKLESGGFYENKQNVTLKGSGMKTISFNLASQTPGNYFLQLRSPSNSTPFQSYRLNLNTKRRSVFIQTDKAVYKPSDKVRFRVLVIDGQTRPVKVENMKIFIADADDNRVKQFDKIFFRHGVFKQEFQLSEEPMLGVWTIHVNVDDDEETTVKAFEVDEYVLPTFEVKITNQENWRQGEDIVVSYSARYTYGKEVDGEATLTASVANDWWWEPEPHRTLTKILNSTTTTINPKLDLNIQSVTYIRSITITINVRERLTGKEQSASTIVNIYEIPFFINLISSQDSIKPQIPFTITATVSDVNNIPVRDSREPIVFTITYTLDELETQVETTTTSWSNFWWRPPVVRKQITETREGFLREGVAKVNLTITPNVTSISVEARFMGASGFFYGYPSPTASGEYIEANIVGELTLSKATTVEVIGNKPIKTVNYVVLGRNKILASARVQVGGNKKTKISFTPTVEMLPISKLIVFYTTSDGEIISDRLDLNYGNEMKNFLSIDVSTSTSKPSTLVNLTLRTKQNSYVGLLGVDQSVLLLKSGNDIDRESVSNELSTYTYANVYNTDWEEAFSYRYFTDFIASSAVILTNAKDEYRVPDVFPAPAVAGGFGGPATTSTQAPVGSTQIKPESITSPGEVVTRKFFPETWLFDCVENTRGLKTITKVIPDSITSWIITGFSINTADGLGLTKQPTKLTVFMPFFVSLNLPYSIKRGETIAIEIIVFNYMLSDVEDVSVTLHTSPDFTVEGENTQKITAKLNAGTSVKIQIRATKIGYINLLVDAISPQAGDKIKKFLLVEPEGVTEYVNDAIFVDLRSMSVFTGSFEVKIPTYAIADTVKVEASVIGDLLGPTIENIEKLINLPSGCGEQNMLSFVPDIVVLDYLSALKKLTPELQKKLLNYLEVGYQRELTYKHHDGSYSAFGQSDNRGSTWLTAFVIRSFVSASKYITIDTEVIKAGLSFLASIQSEDGDFPENGVVFHRAMQGGASSGVTLTAYALVTLLESGQQNTKALDYLERNVVNLTDDYALAISAYALTLANRKALAETLLTKISKRLTSVETAGYLLLTYNLLNRTSDALTVAKWLVKQRNQFGGFDSTQETVVGLTALAQVALKISASDPNFKIDLRADDGSLRSFNVTKANALVLQKAEFASSVRKIDLTAKGSGFGVLQVSYHYNHIEEVDMSIELSANVEETTVFGYRLKVCAKVTEERSNMAVIEVESVSGFGFDVEQVKRENLSNDGTQVKRIDFTNGDTTAIIYFDYFTNQPQCVNFAIVRLFDVFNQKPAAVTAYDYYDPSHRATIFYSL